MSMLFNKLKGDKKIFSAIQKTFKNRNTSIPTSFSKFVNQLETSILEGAGNSIQLLESPTTFDEVWKSFKNQLQIFDELR